MENAQFERLKAQFAAVSAEQTLEVEDLIEGVVTHQVAEIALARRTMRTRTARTCPHCQSNDIALHGKDQNGRQRFKCHGCLKTYNILTGTPMARARMPEKWGQYLACMTEHMPVRTIVASGIGIHQVTAWRWRHRFLKAAANDNASMLSGVVEASVTFFPRSFKGSRGYRPGQPPENRTDRPRACEATRPGSSHEQVPVLTALDNSGGVFEAILASLTSIEASLEGRIAGGSVLCSNGDAVYAKVADKANAENYIVSVPITLRDAAKFNPVTSAPKPGPLGLGRVKKHHQRLKDLIDRRCLGVATKYLGNYLGWNRALIRSGFEGRALLDRALA